VSPSSTIRQLVVFTLGAEEYALPVTRVQEIIRYGEPRRVVARDAWIRGVINLRGKILPVCDLAQRLGIPTVRAEGAKIVIVETGHGNAGLIVDDVEEVLTVEESQLDPSPTAGVGEIEAIATVGERLVILLDPDGLFADVEVAA
jgi:purine-binding chemotaxis protein CheW